MNSKFENTQLEKLEVVSWSKQLGPFLDQARVQQDQEGNRLKTTNLKVQIYIGLLLALLAATFALLRIVEKSFWITASLEGGFIVFLLAIATVFWIQSIFSGFKALSVGTYNYLGVEDFVEAAEASKPRAVLISKILEVTVLNQSLHNEKIDYLRKMHGGIEKLIAILGVGLLGAVIFAILPYLEIAIDCVLSLL